MLSPEQLLSGLPAELTLRFFATFARFEFALKHTGCLRRIEDGAVAEACRVRLRARLPQDFFETVKAPGQACAIPCRA
jgi:hypothetical protein